MHALSRRRSWFPSEEDALIILVAGGWDCTLNSRQGHDFWEVGFAAWDRQEAGIDVDSGVRPEAARRYYGGTEYLDYMSAGQTLGGGLDER